MQKKMEEINPATCPPKKPSQRIKTILCARADLAHKSAREFSLTIDGLEQSIFIVKRHEEIFAYRNACPHTGGPLNWQGDVFLDLHKEKIQCSLHGALFEIHSGKCTYGPCKGKHLQALEVVLENQMIAVLA